MVQLDIYFLVFFFLHFLFWHIPLQHCEFRMHFWSIFLQALQMWLPPCGPSHKSVRLKQEHSLRELQVAPLDLQMVQVRVASHHQQSSIILGTTVTCADVAVIANGVVQ
jgi:hypothetical protein